MRRRAFTTLAAGLLADVENYLTFWQGLVDRLGITAEG
jgi:hypothetical protein